MARRLTVVAAMVAATLLSATLTAAAGEETDSFGPRGALRLESLSGPAQYVSGGTVRIRVVVPQSVPLAAARGAGDGADGSSAFGRDDQAPHALEGVLRDLPIGPSTVQARVPHRG